MCPFWKYCKKKSCIENEKCCSDEYWAAHASKRKWRGKIASVKPQHKSNRQIKREAAIAASTLVYKGHPLCSKKGDSCDKHEACRVINQCVVTLSRIVNNQKLLDAMRGPHTLKSIILLLRQYDPEPMKSYYFCQKKKL